MRQVDLGSAADTVGALEMGSLVGLEGTGSERLNAWIAQADIDGSALDTVLDAERWLFRNWTPEGDARMATVWLHLVQTPSVDHLCSDIARVVASIERSELPECVAEYLGTRARTLLDVAAQEILDKPDALVAFLSGATLNFTDGEVRYWRDLSLNADRVVDAFASKPFGLYRLRDCMSAGIDGFDSYIAKDPEKHLPRLRSELTRILADEPGTPSLPEFLDGFPCLRQDPVALAMMVRELERRERFMPSASSLDERDLLRAVDNSVAWTADLVLAFADLDETALRHPAAFAAASSASIREAWARHPAAASYAALRLHRLLRFAIARDRTQECVELDESFLQTLGGLPGGERILWLLDRVSELFIGVAMEKIAWIYLEGGAKGHWRWLVYGRLVTEPEIVDAFVRFAMGSLPRETYNDVEQLVVELLRDADRWVAVEEISSADGGIAMLRAGNLLRRRRLGGLKTDYHIDGDDGKSRS